MTHINIILPIYKFQHLYYFTSKLSKCNFVYIYCFPTHITPTSSPIVAAPKEYRTKHIQSVIFVKQITKQLSLECRVAVCYHRHIFCQFLSKFLPPKRASCGSLFFQHVPTTKCSMRFLFPPSQKHTPQLQLHLKNESICILRNRLYSTLQW